MGDLSTRIKAKYPQYQGVPDDQLEQMIVKKYPQYQSMVQPKQNIVDKAVNSNFIPGLTSTIGSIAGMPGGLLGSAAGAGAGQAVGMGLQNSAQRLTDPNVSTRDKLLMAAKAAPGFISGGIPGAVGNLSGQGMAQLDPKDVALRSAKTGATDLAFGAAGKMFGAVAKPLGKKLFRWGYSIPKASVGKKDYKGAVDAVINKTEYKDIVEKMIDRGFRGKPEQIGAKAKQGLKTTWNQVEEILKKHGDNDPGLVSQGTNIPKKVMLTIDDFKEPLRESMRGHFGSQKTMVKKYLDVLDDLVRDHGREFNLRDLVEINKNANKKMWGNAAGTKSTSQGAVNIAHETIQKVVKDAIYDVPKLKGLLDEYGILSDIGKIAEKAYTKEPTKISNILQLVNLPFKIAQNPVSATNIGSALYKGGQYLPKVTAPLGAYLGSQSE